ncbi:NAD(P)-binding protein [Calocera cornea HHB12733]|uniref:NAD(P)-binding protein n=1 Tax=Calocera cornea HHB12733 TaxID=1353952 RepID=A0A165K749_9BASI|nr:NAD(P)-binding protein [Calocera cornea HHB12733]
MPDRNVVVFLGGTSGIGREAIKVLLAAPQPRRPWHVILGSRTPKGDYFGKQYLDRPSSAEGDLVDCFHLDLSRFQSVRTFAAQLEKYVIGPIETLVLCAGIICMKKRTTEDGYEETMQVNALAEALLLDLLWPKLSAPGRKSRILFVSSALHLRAAKKRRLTPSNIDTYPKPNRYKTMSAYADSKLLLMHIFYLAEIRSQSDPNTRGCEVIALSPGFVPFTGLVRESGCLANWASKWILPWLPFAKTPQQSGSFIAQFITDAPLYPEAAVHDERAPLLPKSGTYVSISKGEIPAAEECYDEHVRNAWLEVLRDRGLWHARIA